MNSYSGYGFTHFFISTYLMESLCALYSHTTEEGRLSTLLKDVLICDVMAWSLADRFHMDRMSSWKAKKGKIMKKWPFQLGRPCFVPEIWLIPRHRKFRLRPWTAHRSWRGLSSPSSGRQCLCVVARSTCLRNSSPYPVSIATKTWMSEK